MSLTKEELARLAQSKFTESQNNGEPTDWPCKECGHKLPKGAVYYYVDDGADWAESYICESCFSQHPAEAIPPPPDGAWQTDTDHEGRLFEWTGRYEEPKLGEWFVMNPGQPKSSHGACELVSCAYAGCPRHILTPKAEAESEKWPKWFVGDGYVIRADNEDHGAFMSTTSTSPVECEGSAHHRDESACGTGYREVAEPEARAYAKEHKIKWKWGEPPSAHGTPAEAGETVTYPFYGQHEHNYARFDAPDAYGVWLTDDGSRRHDGDDGLTGQLGKGAAAGNISWTIIPEAGLPWNQVAEPTPEKPGKSGFEKAMDVLNAPRALVEKIANMTAADAAQPPSRKDSVMSDTATETPKVPWQQFAKCPACGKRDLAGLTRNHFILAEEAWECSCTKCRTHWLMESRKATKARCASHFGSVDRLIGGLVWGIAKRLKRPALYIALAYLAYKHPAKAWSIVSGTFAAIDKAVMWVL